MSGNSGTPELPGLYCASDEASLQAQKDHVRLLKVSLILLVAGGALSAITIGDPYRTYGAIGGTVVLALSVVLSLIMRISRRDRVWYEARAVAESIKTMAWRYMTCAEPYETPGNTTDSAFLEDLARVNAEHPAIAKEFKGQYLQLPQITPRMRELHSASLPLRRDTYMSERIANQRTWYAGKADSNGRHGAIYFGLMIVFQVAAVFFAGVRATNPASDIHWAALFASGAAALVAWAQFRKYDEVAQSYGQAASELSVIHDKGGAVNTAAELSTYVKDAENAISREHTLWLARRDHR